MASFRIIDISPPVTATSVTWPGDAAYRLSPQWSMEDGDAVRVQTVRTTGHIGAHIDAPAHVLPDGEDVSHIPLESCIGPCFLLDVASLVNTSTTPHTPAPTHKVVSCLTAASGGVPIPRLLLRHYSIYPTSWTPHMPGVEPELVEWFADQGGLFMGVDLNSFDPAQSKDLPCHHTAFNHGVVLAEGLDLSNAPQGFAEIIALPLPWHGADASPVRAILRINLDPLTTRFGRIPQ